MPESVDELLLQSESDWLDVACRPSPGAGYLARLGNVLLLVADASAEKVVPLVEHARMVADNGGPARQLIRGLALMLATEDEDPPSFLAMASLEHGLAVFVSGEATVVSGDTTIDARGTLSWVEKVIPWPVTSLQARVDAETAEPVGPVDLRDGVVRAGGFSLGSQRVVAQRSEVRDERPKKDDWSTQESVSLGKVDPAPESRDPLPEVTREPPPTRSTPNDDQPGDVVLGVRCGNQHFNDPRKLFCGVCGLNMVQETPVLEEGVRPPLGVLVLDDGPLFQLDAQYLIGREPEGDERAKSGDYRWIEVHDRGNKISRVHARLELRGWDVVLIDDESTNGTFVMLKGESDWRRLEPGAEETLVPGSKLRLGDRIMAFSTHQGR